MTTTAHWTLKGNYARGQFMPSTKEHRGLIVKKLNPSNTDELLWILEEQQDQIHAILESLLHGQELWKRSSLELRKQCLIQYGKALQQREEEIALTIAMETGKPLWEAKTEAAALKQKVDITLPEAELKLTQQRLEQLMPASNGYLTPKPIGPILVIGPFNFPCHLANGQIVSALLAGNSILFKPSEKTCYSAQLMVECLHEAGFPPGVINLYQGGGEGTQMLLQSKIIKGIFFTGSLAVGQRIAQQVATQFDKLLALEMGGKNTTIIHADAPWEHSLAETLQSCFLTSGQRCTSTSIVALHESIYDKWLQAFLELTNRITIGHATLSPQETFMGPLIDERSEMLYAQFQAQAIKDGARLTKPAVKLELPTPGHYWSPSVYEFDGPQTAGIIQQEIFAPQVTIVPYKHLEQAIKLANCTEFGLSAAVFSQDREVQQHCLQEIEVGIFNINRSTVGASGKLPFGGFKLSGNYRPAGSAMINACFQSTASIDTMQWSEQPLTTIKGLKK